MMKSRTHSLQALLGLGILSVLIMPFSANAVVRSWDAGGDGINWNDPLNWTDDTLPGPADLVFSGGGGRTITLNSTHEIDALRFNDGDNLNHIGGTLTVGSGGPDTESSMPEFGPASSTYDMSGTAGYNQTDGGLFILARAADLTFTMSDAASMTNAGEIWLGMDSTFDGTMSGNSSLTTPSSIQFRRFASPSSTLRMQDSSILSADGFLVFADDTAFGGTAELELSGSSVNVTGGGLFMRDTATLSFIADASGVSALDINGPIDLFDNGGGMDPILNVDLSAFAGSGDLTLIDGSQGIAGMFRGLPEGSVVPGAGGRTISYVGGGDGFDVVLQVPEPASAFVALLGILGLIAHRREN